MKELFTRIDERIQKGGTISPFLFIWQNLELLSSEVTKWAFSLAKQYDVHGVNIHSLADDGKSLKIGDVKSFFEKSQLQAQWKFQIFIVENISRMTLSATNSCLKVFEEPGEKNIIFLTNKSEAQVLDTILSRVTVYSTHYQETLTSNAFFEDLLQKYLRNKEPGIFSYFFPNTIDKTDQTSFLKVLLSFCMSWKISQISWEELFEDIQLIETNNISPKSVVDKYLLQL